MLPSSPFGAMAQRTVVPRRFVFRTMYGAAPPGDVLAEAFEMVMLRAARGELHIDTERVPLAAIEDAWQQTPQPHRAADWS